MNLPDDDPRMMAHGEVPRLSAEINKAFGVAPWHFGERWVSKLYDKLAKAAGFEGELS